MTVARSKTPNTELVDKTSETLRRQVDKMPETPIRRHAIENDTETLLRLCADDPMWAEHAEVSKSLLVRAADELAALREVKRRCEAESEAISLRGQLGAASGWIVEALKVLDTLDPDDSTEADELGKLIAAGEMLALTTLANSKTPNKPLRRGVDGICTRSTCECEREGLGDQCIWLRPNDAELERRTGEPHIDGWPLYSGLPPPAKTQSQKMREAGYTRRPTWRSLPSDE